MHEEIVLRIIPIYFDRSKEDKIIWPFNRDGNLSIKSAYNTLIQVETSHPKWP